MADLGEGYGDKPFLVVSNNARNSKLDMFPGTRAEVWWRAS